MDKDFIGPFCEEIHLSKEDIQDLNTIKPLVNQILKNGLLLELQAYLKNLNKVFDIVKCLQPELSTTNSSTLKTKFNRLLETKKKLVSKKKVNGVSSVEELNYKSFATPSKKLFVTPIKNTLLFVTPIKNSLKSPEESLLSESYDISPRHVNCEKEENEDYLLNPKQCNSDLTDNGNKALRKDEERSMNLYDYEISKREKILNKVEQNIKQAKDDLENLKTKIGHYAIRNVNKRDKRAQKQMKSLRETERQLFSQRRKNIEHLETILSLTDECNALKNEQENSQVKELQVSELKKLNAQKTASYYKLKASKLTDKIKKNSIHDNQVQSLKSLLKDRDAHIRELEVTNNTLKDQIKEHSFQLENSDGKYSDNVRMCVMELASLEVACEKVPRVMSAVATHLFGCKISDKELPSSTTVQRIVDQGHYIAKTYISHRLAETENWGLNRDGTTRRKQKILDTSITLASGDVMSLGFSRVAHETAETINDITKDHITELADLNSKSDINQDIDLIEQYVKQSLLKLGFTMSDRASNEKKADRLLDEWRDDVLTHCDQDQKHQVLHFHCMAHVLLGFHRYVCSDLKEYESALSAESGKLGREGLSVFKFWKEKGTAVERTLRTVSDVFGPSGDHHGVRDLWEAHCAASGIKSTIGNYQDNRFNALFQTSAEVFLHQQDFIKVLQTVKSPNLKLKSVLADLQSVVIMTIIQCLGLFYVKITGPYWNLVTGSCVPYVELYTEMTSLYNYLEVCCDDPATILQLNEHWNKEDPYQITNIPHRPIYSKQLVQIKETEFPDVLFSSVSLVAKGMKKTMEKQLVDFLPGGSFHKEPTVEEKNRTSFGHITNLGCEHHFGDLDSSQKRRPNASFHHHSSVQILKRNRVPMMKWLDNMPEEHLKHLMNSSRKGGKELREKHKAHDQSVLQEIHTEMTQKKPAKTKRRKHNGDPKEIPNKKAKQHDPTNNDPTNNNHPNESPPESVKENEYVAIAYQDTWYPGIVTSVKSEKIFTVKFMIPTRKFGHYVWPAREDIQSVDIAFVLKTGFIPDCMNSGRQWFIKETTDIVVLYQKFKSKNF